MTDSSSPLSEESYLGYLLDRALRWARWWPPHDDWDHDHCEFCWQKFAATCFTQFRLRFRWTVVDAPAQPPN